MASLFMAVSKDYILASNEAAVSTNTKKVKEFGFLRFTGNAMDKSPKTLSIKT